MLLTSLLLLSAASALPPKVMEGPWELNERCATGWDSFGCTRTMSQSSQALDVTLIFRDELEIRGTIRSCDQEPATVSTKWTKERWRTLSSKARVLSARSLLEVWMTTAQAGCGPKPTPSLSLSMFQEAFDRMDTAMKPAVVR
jgi:hypothetical protein